MAGNSLGHPGPALVYLAKAPAGQTAKTFNGDGAVWFKIAELGPTFNDLPPPNNKVFWAADSESSFPMPEVLTSLYRLSQDADSIL